MISARACIIFTWLLLGVLTLPLTNHALSHTLGEEGEDFLTDDICEENDIISLALNESKNFTIEISDDRPLVILVPGTAAEKGCAKQFRSIIQRLKNGDNIYAINYFKDRWPAGDFTKKNQRDYDWSVALGVKALKKLLEISDARDIWVFGHSKGSHIVSHVASLYEAEEHIKFWAFAQPQRVASSKSEHKGALGKRGYIVKSTKNLVTINWHNDEVWYLKNNVRVQNAWKYPGEVNDPETGGGWNNNRFDHHNNYGGHYKEETCPYFATGDDSRYNDPDETTKNKAFCDTRTVEFHPYFWGDERCFELALAAHYQLQNNDENNVEDPEQIWPVGTVRSSAIGVNVGTKHYIGTSGPRGPNCTPLSAMEVDIQVRYHYSSHNKNRKGFSVRFRDYNHFKANGSKAIAVIRSLGKGKDSHDGWIDTGWETLMLPNSFIFQIDPLSNDASKSRKDYIDIAWVKARFRDPLSNKMIYRYIVGPQCINDDGGFKCNDRGSTPFEGQDKISGKLEGSNLAGWNKFKYRNVQDKERMDVSNWSMKKHSVFKDKRLLEVLRFDGDANSSTAGFYKFYSLLD